MASRGKGALVLLARLDSSRLPGKQLKPLNDDFNVMELLVKRLSACAIESNMIIATSDRDLDQPLEDFALSHDLGIFRGNAHNVAQRCLDCMKAHHLDWYVRICADSPLMDPAIVDQVVEEFLQNDSDLTSNVFISHTFPFGCSVEIITLKAMQRICDSTDDMYYLEHVTAYAYQHPNEFNIQGVDAKEKYSNEVQSISVDTPEDLEKSRWIVSQMDDPIHATLAEIIPLAETWQKGNDI